MLVSSLNATPSPAPSNGPSRADAPGQPPQRPQIPAAFFDALRTARSAAADAITGVRALDRTAPLTDTPATAQVLAATKQVIGALRTASSIEGLNPKLVAGVSAPVEPLMGASLLLSGTIKLGGPARTDLVLDRLDTELSSAWVTASRLLTKLGQPVT